MLAQSDDLNVQGQLPTVLTRTKGPIPFTFYDPTTKNTEGVQAVRLAGVGAVTILRGSTTSVAVEGVQAVRLTKCDEGNPSKSLNVRRCPPPSASL